MPKARLIRVDSGGTDPDGERQEIVIDSVTQLGRVQTLEPLSPKCTAEMLTGVQTAIRIEDENTFISRNHAVIAPPQELEGAGFTLMDLHSTNGTRLNGYDLLPMRWTLLSEGDEIELSSEARFEFHRMEEGASPNHALMVGHFGGNLQGTNNDVMDLKKLLEERGFAGNVQTLFDTAATRDSILRALDVMKRRVTGDSLFVFYFSGHGGEDGSLHLGTWYGRPISAKELLEALTGYRGKILMILDGCYTEAVAQHGMPPRSALIGHEGKAYEGHVTMRPGDEDNGIRGYTTRAICKILEAHPGRINVDELVERLREDPRVRARQKVGYHHRTDITLHTGLRNYKQRY